MSGVRIYPSLVKAKASTMNEQLRKLKGGLEMELTAMAAVSESQAELQGRGWDSARRYVEEVQKPLLQAALLWVSYQTDANDRYFSAGAALPDAAYLDEDELQDELAYWEYQLAREERDDEPDRSMVRFCRAVIRTVKERLRDIRLFLLKTNGIYDWAEAAQAILVRADTEIKKVSYDPTSNEINFASVDYQWATDFVQLQDLRNLEKLKAAGLTEEEIKGGEALGFSLPNLLEVWEHTKNEDDRLLVRHLLAGDYEKAFQANPSKISADSQMFLGSYALHLSQKKGDQALTDFFNAMLKQTQDESNQGVAGHLGSNAKTMDYLKMLQSGTLTQLELELLVFAEDIPLSAEQREILMDRNERLLALATMTASTYDLLKQEMKWGTVTTNFVPDLSRIGVSGVSYNENTKAYSYTLSYEGIKRHFTSVGEGLTEAVERSVFVETRILEYPRDLIDMFYAQSRKELVKAKEELGAKIFTDIVSGGMIGSFSKADTLIGAAAQAFYSMVQSDYGTAANSAYTVVKETDKAAHPRMVDGKEVPIPIMSWFIQSEVAITGAAGARAVLNYRKNTASLKSSIKQADEQQKLTWFGEGGSYRVDGEDQLVVSGIYRPEVMEVVGIWEREGLSAMVKQTTGKPLFPKLGEDEELRNETIAAFVETLTPEEKIIWNGGGILDMEPKAFTEAVQEVKEKYEDEAKGELLDLSGMVSSRIGK